ncbi:hypothetical protein F5Y14DRAFT_456581 [Nemania sp. NC0429]|nr:hypothetical protein F5Y14DRAFT_456581 [Nemania sp. NC0429]
MATFHHFPRLPPELRVQIWEAAVVPRTVEVGIPGQSAVPRRLVSPTPVPAILQTCREARNPGLYQKAFSELASIDAADGEPRHVWLRFEIDTVSIGTTALGAFREVAPLIRRLRLERAHSDEYFYHYEAETLRALVNAREIHVVCADGLGAWWCAAEEHY